MPLENIKPCLLENVYVYSTEYGKIYNDRYVVEVRIKTTTTQYVLNGGWAVDEIYVSKNIDTLIERIVKQEEQKHLLKINLLKSLCVG